MTIYDTKKELLTGLAAKLISRARPYLNKDGWHEPYEETDLEELLQRVSSSKKRRKKEKDTLIEEALAELPESEAPTRWLISRSLFDSFTLLKKAPREPTELRELVQEGTARLWPHVAGRIPLVGLKDFFVWLGWTEKTDVYPVTLAYPVEDFAVGRSTGEFDYGLRYCNIDYVDLFGKTSKDRENILWFAFVIEGHSRALRIHPALALASFLCGLPAYEDALAIITDNSNGVITICVRQPTISPQLVRTTYSIARAKYIESKTGRTLEGYPRVRWSSDKVSALIEFVQGNPDVDWKERWKLWNAKYPHWSYKNPSSMCAVYCKAA